MNMNMNKKDLKKFHEEWTRICALIKKGAKKRKIDLSKIGIIRSQ